MLSKTSMCGNSAMFWNTIEIPRSFGGRFVTSRPLMLTVPSVGLVSPAMVSIVFDFPHPEGPTKVTNSPSLMSRFMSSTAITSSYRLTMCSSLTFPIGLLLECSRGEPADDLFLWDDHEDRHRQDADDTRGGHHVEQYLVLALVLEDPVDDGSPVLGAAVGHEER